MSHWSHERTAWHSKDRNTSTALTKLKKKVLTLCFCAFKIFEWYPLVIEQMLGIGWERPGFRKDLTQEINWEILMKFWNRGRTKWEGGVILVTYLFFLLTTKWSVYFSISVFGTLLSLLGWPEEELSPSPFTNARPIDKSWIYKLRELAMDYDVSASHFKHDFEDVKPLNHPSSFTISESGWVFVKMRWYWKLELVSALESWIKYSDQVEKIGGATWLEHKTYWYQHCQHRWPGYLNPSWRQMAPLRQLGHKQIVWSTDAEWATCVGKYTTLMGGGFGFSAGIK